MSISDFEATTKDDLPVWVEVSGGNLDWERAVVVYREEKGDSKMIHEKVVIPYVPRRSADSSSSRVTLCVLSITWSEFKNDFPSGLVESLEGKSSAGIDEGDLIQFDTLSFVTDNPFVSGLTEAKFKREWKETGGYRDVATVGWKSRPPTRDENWMGLVLGGLILTGGVFCLVRRADSKGGRSSRQQSNRVAEPQAVLRSGVRPPAPVPTVNPDSQLLQTHATKGAISMLSSGSSDEEVMRFLEGEWVGKLGYGPKIARATATLILRRFRERHS